MATTTPNFGWSVPTSSDLVKNGATAIETLGDSIDASLVDLKGGTTGQVLAKASNTDMDFTWSAGASVPTSLGYAAGKNKIMNGDFYINQRAFSSSTTSGAYNFDRWQQVFGGGTQTVTPQPFTLGAAPVAGYEGKTFCRIVTASQSAAGDYSAQTQKIESVRTFAGQTVTVSFWAKASTGTPNIGLSALQQFGTGGSPSANVIVTGSVSAITTSWVRYSFTLSIPSISGKTIGTNNDDDLRVDIWTSAGSTISGLGYPAVGIQNVTIDIWGVQIEAGSTATDFQTASGSIQGELALCQRYYYRITADTAYSQLTNYAPAYSTTNVTVQVPTRVTMRVKPSSVDFSTVTLADGTNFVTASSVAVGTHASASVPLIDIGATGLTATTRSYSLWANNSTSAYLGISAEL